MVSVEIIIYIAHETILVKIKNGEKNVRARTRKIDSILPCMTKSYTNSGHILMQRNISCKTKLTLHYSNPSLHNNYISVRTNGSQLEQISEKLQYMID